MPPSIAEPHASGRRHVFHSLCAAVNAQVWFEFVPSGANLADQPSRDELELLSELGSAAFRARWPDMDASWEKAFIQIFNEFGAKPTKAEKRARRTGGRCFRRPCQVRPRLNPPLLSDSPLIT